MLPVLLLVALASPVLSTPKKGFGLCGAAYRCGDTHALSGTTWWYNWHHDMGEYHNHKCTTKYPHGEYVPMIRFEQDVTSAKLPSNSKHILLFNEPNALGNGYMTPEKVAGFWKTIESKYPNQILVGPGLTSCDTHPEWCIGWYDRFFKACPKCRMNKIAVHAYHCDPYKIMQSLEKISKHFGRQLWLTEFACETSYNIDDNIRFMQTLIPLLEKAPFIERYAWYCSRMNKSDKNHNWNLLNMDSPSLTKLGHVYNNIH